MGFIALVDLLNPPDFVPKQRVIDNFSGDVLNERWNTRDIAGSGTFAMSDAVGEGFSITSGATSGNSSLIDFNDINHYAHNGSVMISVSKNVTSTSYFHVIGLVESGASPADTRISYTQDSTNSFQVLHTILNSTSTEVDTSLSLDQNFNLSRLETRASSGLLSVNGILEAISTTNLPDVALQPHFRQGTRTSGAREGLIRYTEVYNT